VNWALLGPAYPQPYTFTDCLAIKIPAIQGSVAKAVSDPRPAMNHTQLFSFESILVHS